MVRRSPPLSNRFQPGPGAGSALLRALVILSTFALLAGGPAAGCAQVVDDERVPDRTAPIIGGTVHNGHVAVGALAWNGGGFFCTGTLIAPRVVLTAAHCAEGMSSGTVFRTGTWSSAPDETIPIVGYRIPNGWFSSGFDYDIAVAELAYDAPFAPIAHNTNGANVMVGTNALFVGYGDDGMGGSGVKRSVVMQIDSAGSHSFDYYDTAHNTCYGDSGGPAIVIDAAGNEVVVGVTSHGDPNCATSGTDTRVDAHKTWLDAQIFEIMGTSAGSGAGSGSGSGSGSGAGSGSGSGSGSGGSVGGTCSAAGVCGGQAPDGCYCDSECLNYNDCCPDACTECGTGCSGSGSGSGSGGSSGSGSFGDPCQGIDFAGTCIGDTVVYCFSGMLFAVDCASGGYSCGIESVSGAAICF